MTTNPILEAAKAAEATATKNPSDTNEEEEEDGEDLESIGGEVSESVSVDLSKMESATGTPSLSEEEDRKNKLDVARKETAAIMRLRVMVFSVLILSALAVSIIIFKVTKTAQEEEFIKQYEGSAKLVMDTFTEILETKLGAVSSMGVAIIAHSLDNAQGTYSLKCYVFVTLV